MSRRVLLAVILGCLMLGAGRTRLTPAAAAQPDCTLSPAPGDDLGAAATASAPGAVLCLAAGVYPPFLIGSDAPARLTIRGNEGGAVIEAAATDAVVLTDVDQLTLENVTVRGGSPAALYARDARSLTFRDLRVEGGRFGVLLDEGTTATIERLTVDDPAEAGLLVRRSADVTASGVTVRGSGGLGVAAIFDGARLTLRDSTIDGGPGAAVFAGDPGCAELLAATLEVPACFHAAADAYESDTRVVLEQVTVLDGAGPGLVFYPGVEAEVRGSAVRGRMLGGLFAWGARVAVSDSDFELNAVHGIEFRAYLDPRGLIVRRAAGSVTGSTVSLTRPIGIDLLGHGIVTRAADVTLTRNDVSGNAGVGIVLSLGSTGEIEGNTAFVNGGPGICLSADSAVAVGANSVTGNRDDDLVACAQE